MKRSWMEDIMKLMVSVMPLIVTAEHAFSGKPGSGEAKKQTVLLAVATGLNAYNQFNKQKITAAQTNAIMNNVAELTDGTVEIMNTVDLFKKNESEVKP